LGVFRKATVLTALSIVAFSAYFTRKEMGAMMRSQNDAEVFLSAMAAPPAFERSLSNISQFHQMTQCDNHLSSVIGALMGQSARSNVADGCAQRAEEILESSPTLSVAHLVQANAAFVNGEISAAVESLRVSQATAPSEGWLATRRLRVSFAIGAQALGETAALDAQLIIKDLVYRNYLVTFYQERPQHRDWIAEATMDIEGPYLRDFFNLVRSASMEGGS